MSQLSLESSVDDSSSERSFTESELEEEIKKLRNIAAFNEARQTKVNQRAEKELENIEQEIKALEAENEELERELGEGESQSDDNEKEENASEKQEAIDKKDKEDEECQASEEEFLAEIEAEERKIAELEEMIENVDKETEQVEAECKEWGCDDDDDYVESDSDSEGDENELQLVNEKYSIIKSENEQLRAKISALKDEDRIALEKLLKLKQELAEEQKEFEALNKETTEAQQSHEETLNRIRSLKERGAKVINSLENQERANNRALQNESKLRSYMEDKTRERSALSFDEINENGLKDKNRAESPSVARAEQDHAEFMEKMSMQDSIRLVDKENQFEKVLERHNMNEAENYTLFNQINHLNSELKKKQQQVASLEAEIKEVEGGAEENQGSADEEMKALDEETERVDKELELVQEKDRKAGELLATTHAIAEEICEILGIELNDLSSDQSADGEKNHPTMKIFMKIEEQLHVLSRAVDDNGVEE